MFEKGLNMFEKSWTCPKEEKRHNTPEKDSICSKKNAKNVNMFEKDEINEIICSKKGEREKRFSWF